MASGFLLALPFMAGSAMAAPASPTPLANPAHHHVTAGHASVTPAHGLAAPALAASTPARTFHPVAAAPDAPQEPGHLNSGLCFSTAPGNPCTLRAAVMEANAEGEYIAIVLQAGTYHLTIPPANTTDASTGNLDVTDAKTVTFTGAGITHTVIDGSGMSSGPNTGDRIFQLEDHAVARMTGFTVQHGDAADTTNNTDPKRGGGIDISSSAAALVLQQVRIQWNSAADKGGGVYNAGSLWATKSELSGNAAGTQGGGLFAEAGGQLVDVTITGNNATERGGGVYVYNGPVSLLRGSVSNNHLIFTSGGAQGGGIYVDDATTIVGTSINNNTIAPATGATPVVHQGAQGGGLFVSFGLNQADHVTVHGNTVAGLNDSPQCCFGDGGGGIYDGAGFAMTNSVISGNKALDGLGGGILNGGNGEQLSHVTVWGNQAVTRDGGGIYGYNVTYISQSAITGNVAAGNGGGFWGDDGQQIDQTLIANNTALQGGGIWNEWKMTLTNDTLTGNTAVGTGNSGGAFYNSSGSGVMAQLTNVTINGNKSDDGGGIAQFGSGFTLHNTIVAGNTANTSSTDTNCDISSIGATAVTDAGNNLDSGNTCGLNGPGSHSNTNPKLGPLANNGGPTRTEALLTGSPAINNGANPAPTVDQRGVARDSRPDIGAFEVRH